MCPRIILLQRWKNTDWLNLVLNSVRKLPPNKPSVSDHLLIKKDLATDYHYRSGA